MRSNSAVTATFNQPVQANTIVFELRDSANNLVPASLTYDNSTYTATLTPSAALTAATTYTATVSGATNLNGLAMSAPVSWSFTTLFAWMSGTTVYAQTNPLGTPLFVGSTGTVNITAGSDTVKFLGVSNVIVQGTGSNDTVNVTSLAFPLTINGGAGQDVLNVNAGTCTISGDAGAGTSHLTINLASGATLNLAGDQHLESLAITGGSASLAAGGHANLYTQTLSIDSTGKLDLNDNGLVVNNGSFTAIQNLVFSGYSASPDASKTGIVSTTGQNAGNTILLLFSNAYAGAADWPIGSGNTVSPGAVIGRYSYFGDTNLDGQITGDDYAAIDANLGTTGLDPGVAVLYGDSNFDNQITGDDYSAIDANLGLGAGNPLAMGSVAQPASIVLAPSQNDSLTLQDPATSLLAEL